MSNDLIPKMIRMARSGGRITDGTQTRTPTDWAPDNDGKRKGAPASLPSTKTKRQPNDTRTERRARQTAREAQKRARHPPRAESEEATPLHLGRATCADDEKELPWRSRLGIATRKGNLVVFWTTLRIQFARCYIDESATRRWDRRAEA